MLFLPQENLEQAERDDLVDWGKEQFLAYLDGRPTRKVMPRSQQHEFGPHLRSIEESKRRFRQVGHGRYW